MYMHHTDELLLDPVCACTALRKASRAVTRLYDEALAGSGMSIVQFSVLRHIAREGQPELMRLAETLVMDRTTLYRALKPLEQRGWVALSDAARRAKHVALTPAGEAALRAATEAWRAAQSRLLGGYGAAEWARMQAGLARLVTLSGERGA